MYSYFCSTADSFLIFSFIFIILTSIRSPPRTYRNVFLGRIRIPMNEIAACGEAGVSGCPSFCLCIVQTINDSSFLFSCCEYSLSYFYFLIFIPFFLGLRKDYTLLNENLIFEGSGNGHLQLKMKYVLTLLSTPTSKYSFILIILIPFFSSLTFSDRIYIAVIFNNFLGFICFFVLFYAFINLFIALFYCFTDTMFFFICLCIRLFILISISYFLAIYFSLRWFFDQATDDLNKKIAQKQKGMISRIASFLRFGKKRTTEVNIEIRLSPSLPLTRLQRLLLPTHTLTPPHTAPPSPPQLPHTISLSRKHPPPTHPTLTHPHTLPHAHLPTHTHTHTLTLPTQANILLPHTHTLTPTPSTHTHSLTLTPLTLSHTHPGQYPSRGRGSPTCSSRGGRGGRHAERESR